MRKLIWNETADIWNENNVKECLNNQNKVFVSDYELLLYSYMDISFTLI